MRLKHTTSIVTVAFLAAFGSLVLWRVLQGPKKRPVPAVVAAPPPAPLPLEPPIAVPRIENSGLPCDVDDVMARKCRRCHSLPPRHSAPFRMLTWDDTRLDRSGMPLYRRLGEVVMSGYMPYRIMANPPIEPLTDAEKKILLDWVAAGGPRGDCGSDAGSDASADAAADAVSDASARPARRPR